MPCICLFQPPAALPFRLSCGVHLCPSPSTPISPREAAALGHPRPFLPWRMDESCGASPASWLAAPWAPSRYLNEQAYRRIFSMKAVHRQQEGGLSPRPFPTALSLPFAFPLLLTIPPSQLSAGAIPADLTRTQLGCMCLSRLPREKEPAEGDVQTHAVMQAGAGRQTREEAHERNRAEKYRCTNTHVDVHVSARQPEQLRARHVPGLKETSKRRCTCRQARGDRTPTNA